LVCRRLFIFNFFIADIKLQFRDLSQIQYDAQNKAKNKQTKANAFADYPVHKNLKDNALLKLSQ